MEMVLNNGFCEMTFDEMLEIDGGGWKQCVQVFAGTILVAWTPVIGIGAGIVGTPIAGVTAAGGSLGLGLSLIGAGTH